MTDQSEYTHTPETPDPERRRLAVQQWQQAGHDGYWAAIHPVDPKDVREWAEAHGYALAKAGDVSPSHRVLMDYDANIRSAIGAAGRDDETQADTIRRIIRERDEACKALAQETCQGCGQAIADCVAGWGAPDAGGCSGKWPGRVLLRRAAADLHDARDAIRETIATLNLVDSDHWAFDGVGLRVSAKAESVREFVEQVVQRAEKAEADRAALLKVANVAGRWNGGQPLRDALDALPADLKAEIGGGS